jgi:hypothetical protein
MGFENCQQVTVGWFFGMRRLAAIALPLPFLFPIGAPFLSPDGQENLPPCCRRDGKHHCAMMDRAPESSSGGPAVKAASLKCPLFPSGAIVSGKGTYLVPTTSQSFCAAVVTYPALCAQVEGPYCIYWSRSHQKRGPPAVRSS